MKVVGTVACTVGVAYTYMVREELIRRVKARGHECRIKTQRTISVEYKLTEQETAEADMVILAVDVKISGGEQFKREPVIRVDTTTVIKSVVGFIEEVEKTMENKG